MSIMSELKLQQAALERENLELRNSQYNNSDGKKPPIMPRMSSQSQLSSTPVQHPANQVRFLTNEQLIFYRYKLIILLGAEHKNVTVSKSGRTSWQQSEEDGNFHAHSTRGSTTKGSLLHIVLKIPHTFFPSRLILLKRG